MGVKVVYNMFFTKSNLYRAVGDGLRNHIWDA